MDHTTTSPTPTTENLQERSGFVKIPWVSRIAYGLGDTSCNVVYGMINTLLTLFYTDYAGIPFVTVGLVMLISRFFDGSSDVIMGVVVSKTRSRWGSSRPWLLWTALPYVITSVALFTVPQTSGSLQFWYIFVTYNLCTTVCYTAINVPLGSLSTMMTRDSHERDMLSIVRMTLAPIGRLISVTFTLPVVKLFGNDHVVHYRLCPADFQLCQVQGKRSSAGKGCIQVQRRLQAQRAGSGQEPVFLGYSGSVDGYLRSCNAGRHRSSVCSTSWTRFTRRLWQIWHGEKHKAKYSRRHL